MNRKIKDIQKPEFMKKAVASHSHSAALELLIALAVFLIGDFAVSILQMPAMLVHLLSSGEYIRMIQSNHFDMQVILNLLLHLPAWIRVINMIAEAGLIVVFILYCRLFEKRKISTMGFQKKGVIKESLRGVLLGVFAFAAVYLICLLSGSLQFSADAAGNFSFLYLFGFLLGCMVRGMAEEVICRGYLFVSLTKRYSVIFSIVLSSLFFMMMHGMNTEMSALSYLNLFLFGALMALLMIRYENIWLIGAFHGIWNFAGENIFGVQVSGLQEQFSLFSMTPIDGRGLLNGGSFGLEGGLAMTLVFLGILALLLWRMKKKGYFIEKNMVLNSYDIEYNRSRMPKTAAPYEQGQNPPVKQQPQSEMLEPEDIEQSATHLANDAPVKFDASYFKEEEDDAED